MPCASSAARQPHGRQSRFQSGDSTPFTPVFGPAQPCFRPGDACDGSSSRAGFREQRRLVIPCCTCRPHLSRGMTPSHDHEVLKNKMARLLEAYAEELGIELELDQRRP